MTPKKLIYLLKTIMYLIIDLKVGFLLRVYE